MEIKQNPKIILKVLIGSRAHGTATDESDIDERLVYVLPTSSLLTASYWPHRTVKSTLWVEGEEKDSTGWEIGHYIKLATHCNPTVLELLWAPVIESDKWGKSLRNIRNCFPTRQRVFDAFRGYAANQVKKMMFEPGSGIWGVRNWKFAEAYIRVLYQGVLLLTTGELPVDFASDPNHKSLLNTLISIRRGEMTRSKVVECAESLEINLASAYLASKIPDEPDLEKIDEFLLKLRKENW